MDKNKVKTVLEVGLLVNQKELQSLIGKINFMRRFITNSTSKLKDFLPLPRLKQAKEFIWVVYSKSHLIRLSNV